MQQQRCRPKQAPLMNCWQSCPAYCIGPTRPCGPRSFFYDYGGCHGGACPVLAGWSWPGPGMSFEWCDLHCRLGCKELFGCLEHGEEDESSEGNPYEARLPALHESCGTLLPQNGRSGIEQVAVPLASNRLCGMGECKGREGGCPIVCSYAYACGHARRCGERMVAREARAPRQGGISSEHPTADGWRAKSMDRASSGCGRHAVCAGTRAVHTQAGCAQRYRGLAMRQYRDLTMRQ